MQRHAIALQKSYQISHGTGMGLRISGLCDGGRFHGQHAAGFPAARLGCGADPAFRRYRHPKPWPTCPRMTWPSWQSANPPTTPPLLRHMQTLLTDWPSPIANHNIRRPSPTCRATAWRNCWPMRPAFTPRPPNAAPRRSGRRADDHPGHSPLHPAPRRHPRGRRHGAHHQQHRACRLAAPPPAQPRLMPPPSSTIAAANGLYAKQRIVLIQGRPIPAIWPARRIGWCITSTPT